MSELKRYGFDFGNGHFGLTESGPFVRFDDAQYELAALREELTTANNAYQIVLDETRTMHDKLVIAEQRLTAAEQRNAELVELLKRVDMTPLDSWYSSGLNVAVFAAIQPTESGASE